MLFSKLSYNCDDATVKFRIGFLFFKSFDLINDFHCFHYQAVWQLYDSLLNSIVVWQLYDSLPNSITLRRFGSLALVFIISISSSN